MIWRLFLFFCVHVVLSLRCQKSSPGSCLYNVTCSYEIEECNSSSIANIRGGVFCTTVIQRTDDGILLGTMGCMYDQETTKQCANEHQCRMTFTNKEREFSHCCCDDDLCNFNFTLPTSLSRVSTEDSNVSCEGMFCKWSVLIVLGVVFVGLLLIFVLIGLINRKRLMEKFFPLNGLCGHGHSSIRKKCSPSIEKEKEVFFKNQLSLVDLDLNGHLLKKGRFSRISSGSYRGQSVAYKTLLDSNSTGEAKKLFENEREIYSLPLMTHPNLLKYFGYWENGEKFVLVTELSVHGSLRDVLQNRLIVDLKEVFWISESISKGLEYLHKDFHRGELMNNEQIRPPIAHRDLKSENILFLNENQIVICDFALSTPLDQKGNYPNEQQQIGTPRYMSPEILAGTIGCDPNALLRCDVYALGLIFWEILSRCAREDGSVVYQMPYEEQLKELKCSGTHPSVSDMLTIVNCKEVSFKRPPLKSSWRNSSNHSLIQFVKTIEECWDDNPDSRISSASVASRLNKL